MDVVMLWETLLVVLHTRLNDPHSHDVWLARCTPVRLHDDRFIVHLPNIFYRDWITENYLATMNREVSGILDRPTEIALVIAPRTDDDAPTGDGGGEARPGDQPAPPGSVEPLGPRDPSPPNGGPQSDITTWQTIDRFGDLGQPISTDHSQAPLDSATFEQLTEGLNHRQTFDSFVIGECNKFAHAAALAVSESPADGYNPLYIYGGTGLGKTHMMHAIGNQIARNLHQQVVYTTAEDFVNEMINALRYKHMEDFRTKYRKRAAVLLVDDIQFLSGKDRTQEEFFHTFNALQTSGRQIVLTSDVSPKEIDKLMPRLRTRFEGGLLADMQAPDRETLVAILHRKGDERRMTIPSDVAEAIADAVQGNIRELQGIIKRLAAQHEFYRKPITLDFARRAMPELFSPPKPNVTVPQIIQAVARFHNIRSADITGPIRTQAMARPRQIAMFLARKHTSLSFPDLGREFGGRDHSTIQYGFRKIEKELTDNSDLSYKVRLVEAELKLRSSAT